MKYLGAPTTGSQANTTASRNRFGQYYRTRAIPVNPNTVAQTNARAAFGGCSVQWTGMSPEQRAGWSAYAVAHPSIDSLGQVKVLTGFMAFVACRTAMIAAGYASSAVPDQVPEDPLPPAPVLTAGEVIFDSGSLTSAEASFTTTPVPALHRYTLWVSPPRSPAVTFNGDYRLIANVAPAAVSPFDFTLAYATRFGNPNVGQTVFMRARAVRADGAISPWSNVLYRQVSTP